MTSTLPSPSAGQERDYPPLPVAEDFMYQHEETGITGFIDAQQVEWGFFKNNPRLHKVRGVYTEAQMRAYVDADRKERQLAACNFCLSQAAEARAALTSACKQEGGEPYHQRICTKPEACSECDRIAALSAPQPPLAGAGEAQIEAAAKVIAASMDYPWDQMPELGRNNMRKHARAIAAALNPKPAPLNGGCGDGESAS